MKKLALLSLFGLFISNLFAQTVDTVINTGVYKSYFCYEYKEPLYVKYKLYQGGGDCNRDKFNFTKGGINSVGKKEYSKSGYDIGHLANAEDFAYDCTKDELTFRYYNALPQTPNLNRGIWKQNETDVRFESQKDSLLILCGGFNYIKSATSSLYVPEYCFKVVISLSSYRVVYCLIFTNKQEENTVEVVNLSELRKKLGYKLEVKE